MPASRSDGRTGFERVRRLASLTALTVFGASFVTLLVVSATPYWTPENELLRVCDQIWKVSGVTALVLGLIPQVRRIGETLGSWLGLRG